MIKTKMQKHDQVLPDIVKEQLRFTKDIGNKGQLKAHIKALRTKGWTYKSIGDALYLTRERARQLAREAHISEINRIQEDPIYAPYLPTPPMIAYEVPDVHVPIQPTATTLQRLLELQPLAEKVRANGSEYRAEAEEYVALVHYANTVENVSVYQLAKVLGITRAAIYSRLVRYGYDTTTGNSRLFQTIREENRVRS